MHQMSETKETPLKFATEISFAEHEFVDLGLHETQAGVFPLVHIKGGVIRPLGTCFSITNDGLCLTARHVVEEGIKVSLDGKQHDVDGGEEGWFGALYVSSEPNSDNPDNLFGGLLPFFRVHMSDGLDIALIKLTLPVHEATGECIRFPAHKLRMSLPGVGEGFLGLGYRMMDWQSDASNRTYHVNHKYAATRGQVEELHAGGRDLAMLPFPCFRTSARLDAGMSGGPLIDYSGNVFGVVCSSFGTATDDEGYISYASLLAPAMAMTLDVSDVASGVERKAFLWELVEGGAIIADRRGFEVEHSGDHLTLVIGQSLKLTAILAV